MSRFLLNARYPLIFVALGYGLLVIFVRPERRPPHPFFAGSDFHVIAHRGGADVAPESTLPVYRRALDIGVDVLDADVHSTADSVLVVLHDRSVDRTTDGSGRVEQLTLAQLQALGTKEGQGYLFTPALTAFEAGALIEGRPTWLHYFAEPKSLSFIGEGQRSRLS